MNEFRVVDKTFVKSKNSVKEIYKHYTYSLLGFIILTIISYLFINKEMIAPLITSLGLSLIIGILSGFIINEFTSRGDFIKLFTEDNIHIIALIVGLFSVNVNIFVQIVAVIIAIFIKKVYKKINLSSSLYGILVILLYKYFIASIDIFNVNYIETFETKKEIFNYLLGQDGLSIILSLITFIYLFNKKAIKYSIYLSYVLTFVFIIGIYSLISEGNMLFLLYVLSLSNVLFFSTYLLPDYIVTPQISEGQIIYGMILGILSSILIFFIPNFAIVISLILGPILLTKLLDSISSKLKYNQKYYNIMLSSLIFLIIVVSILLIVLF